MSTLVARLRVQNGLYVQPALGRGTSFDCADERRRDQTDFGPVHKPNFNRVRPSSSSKSINSVCLNVELRVAHSLLVVL